MTIDERESRSITGRLPGLIPAHRRFELELLDTGETIYGSVSLDLAKTHTDQLLGKVEGKIWRTRMRVREKPNRSSPPAEVAAPAAEATARDKPSSEESATLNAKGERLEGEAAGVKALVERLRSELNSR